MNMAHLDQRIRERAYAIWEREGGPDGRQHDHWEQAVREILMTGQAALGGKKAAPTFKKPGTKSRNRKAA